MFVAMWLAIVLGNAGEITPMQWTERTRYDTEAVCQKHLDNTKARMPDWVRGAINATLDQDVTVEGKCVSHGAPA